MSTLPTKFSRARRRMVVAGVLGLSALSALASTDRGLLPLHPRMTDAQIVVPVPVPVPSQSTMPPRDVVRDVALDARAVVALPVLPERDPSVMPPKVVARDARAVATRPDLPERAPPSNPTAQAAASGQPRATLPFDALIRRTAQAKSLDAALLHAIIDIESGYDPQAVSGRGAIGLMQVLPRTGQRFGVRRLEDPAENLRAGASYLRWLLSRFDDDVTLALAAYNAGEGAVLRYGRQVPPFPETQNYVRKVLAGYSRLRDVGNAPPVAQADAPPAKRSMPSNPAPAPLVQAHEDQTAHAWRLLQGLGTLITRSPSAEAQRAGGTGKRGAAGSGRGRDQPAVAIPSRARERTTGAALRPTGLEARSGRGAKGTRDARPGLSAASGHARRGASPIRPASPASPNNAPASRQSAEITSVGTVSATEARADMRSK
ncbi:transglycosylase SLT domain-containing protein [Pandoraea sp. NPDC087047]|uniref:lytic transglycosylase domain-containing protein n=1 Tax=Pandoraea sp. NPDC087047 TaxID=3364390 RepID=UPI00382EBA0F